MDLKKRLKNEAIKERFVKLLEKQKGQAKAQKLHYKQRLKEKELQLSHLQEQVAVKDAELSSLHEQHTSMLESHEAEWRALQDEQVYTVFAFTHTHTCAL